MHLRDCKAQEQLIPPLLLSAVPECEPAFWPTIRKLLVEGAPQDALQLLQRHAALSGENTAIETHANGVLARLQAMLENLPRLMDASLLQSQAEDEMTQPAINEALTGFKMQWNVWTQDVACLQRDADALAIDPAIGKTMSEVSSVLRILTGNEAQIKRDSQGAWHGELLAKLLYQRPTQYRWEASLSVTALLVFISPCLPCPPPTSTS